MKGMFGDAERTGNFPSGLLVAAAILVCVVFLTAQDGGIRTKDKDQAAKDAIDAAHKVLGGAEKIDGIKSLIIKGTQTSTAVTYGYRYETLGIMEGKDLTAEFEIRILPPDRYIEIVRYPDRTIRRGVSQDKVLSETLATGVALEIRMWRERVECTHILLGTLMKSGPMRVTLSSTKDAGIFDLDMYAGSRWGEVPSRIQIDPRTGYPSSIAYEENNSVGGGETVYQFSSERFSVDGFMFPRFINTHRTLAGPMRGSVVTVEKRIEEVRINPELSPKDF